MVEFLTSLLPESIQTLFLSGGDIGGIPVEVIVAGLVIFCGGLLKGLAGIGAPMLAIPIMATLYDVPTAISIMILPLFVSSAWQVWIFRHAEQNRRMLFPLLFACTVGVVLGTFFLGAVPEVWPAIVLAILVFVYVGLYLFRPDLVLPARKAVRTAVPVGLVTGILQGAAGVSTPLSVTYVHAQRLERGPYMLLLQSVFSVLTATQILALSAFGIMTPILAAASFAALVPLMSGIWLGQYLSRFTSQRLFEHLSLVVLSLIALGLLVRAIPEIMA